MNRTTMLVAAAALAIPAAPAIAKPKPTKPTSPYKCIPKSIGYAASGTLVSDGLTQTAGQDTAKRGDDRYSGELVVSVRRVNHGGTKGNVTYTLANARVRLHPHSGTAAAGSRVKVKGQVTKAGKHCDATSFTPVVTVRRVDVKSPRS